MFCFKLIQNSVNRLNKGCQKKNKSTGKKNTTKNKGPKEPFGANPTYQTFWLVAEPFVFSDTIVFHVSSGADYLIVSMVVNCAGTCLCNVLSVLSICSSNLICAFWQDIKITYTVVGFSKIHIHFLQTFTKIYSVFSYIWVFSFIPVCSLCVLQTERASSHAVSWKCPLMVVKCHREETTWQTQSTIWSVSVVAGKNLSVSYLKKTYTVWVF